MLNWERIHPRFTFDMLGYIPYWLSEDNPKPAKQQIHEGYTMGGWNSFKGFTLEADNSLTYPGDPPTVPLAQARLRDELIVFYPYSWVAIIQPDRSFEVARID